jgi:transketolase
VASLRLIPNLHVFRPADGVETALAWGHALASTDGPTAIVLTRQKLPVIERPHGFDLVSARRGAYRVAGDGRGRAVVAATGSEVHLAIGARAALEEEGIPIDVVSMPCVELFEEQAEGFKRALFPDGVPVATVEAGRTTTWRALAGPGGLTLGIDHFGASAPAGMLADKFGFTVPAVTDAIRAWLAGR